MVFLHGLKLLADIFLALEAPDGLLDEPEDTRMLGSVAMLIRALVLFAMASHFSAAETHA
jgi:hypothetical protein